MQLLNEGMRPGDLEDLVLPMISVDEYESKLDDSAIVIGFYVHDKDAADDLNRYLQKTPSQILDTEVSPAPDQHGYYLVFLELMNDGKIVDSLEDILAEISPLASIENWQMRVRDVKGVKDFSRKVLDFRFRQLRDGQDAAESNEQMEESILEWLVRSDLRAADLDAGRLFLDSGRESLQGRVVNFGDIDTFLEAHSLTESAVSLDTVVLAENARIERLLGEGWTVCRLGEHVLVCRTGSASGLLLAEVSLL